MTVVIDGQSLRPDEVVRVARGGEGVELAPGVLERVSAGRRAVERALELGTEVYGLTTGVGVRKRNRVEAAELAAFNRRLILDHRVGQGPPAPDEVVRAMTLRLANALAGGATGVRPALVEHVVARLDRGPLLRVRLLGSLGMGDLPANADLAHGLLDGFELAAGEGLALLGGNAFSTGLAALAVADAELLLAASAQSGALALEAFGANVSALDPEVARSRPYPGLALALERLRALLAGGDLLEAGAARNLQDPLVFRCLPQVHGALLDAFAHAERTLAIELNASQQNPLVTPGGAILSVGSFDVLPLAQALDLLRLALAPAISAASERTVKLLQAPLSGLPEGLAEEPGLVESALSELGVPSQALAAEARLLAQPVSAEQGSSSHHEGLEDRITLAPLAARRLAEQVELGARVVAVELVVSAQAVDLRGRPRLGAGTAPAYEAVRRLVPRTRRGEPPPQDLEPLWQLVRRGALG